MPIPSYVEFLAMFLGFDYEKFDLKLEITSPSSFGKCPIKIYFLACSNFSKSYKTSLSLFSSKTSRHPWFFVSLLILSGNVELNPGPRTYKFKYPCGVCSRPCKDNQPAIQCDSCNLWYHKKCLSMNTIVYKALENSSCSWICCQCGLPNFSSSLFDSSQSLDHSNSFQPLYQYNDHTTPLLDLAPPNSFKPQKASTPRKPPNDQCTDETSHPRPDCLPRPKKNKKHSITSLLMNFMKSHRV